MEEKMSPSAKSTVKTIERGLTVHRILLLLAILSMAWLGNAPVIAQDGKSPAPTSPSSPISLSDEIRSVKEAYATSGGDSAEPASAAEAVTPVGSVAPQTIMKTFMATAYCLKGQTAS